MLSSSIYHRTASRIQPCTKQRSTYIPGIIRADQSATTQASRPSRVGESQHVFEHLSAAHCFKTNEEIEACSGQNNIPVQPGAAVVMREGFAFTTSNGYNTMQHSFLFGTRLNDACMRRPGWFPGGYEETRALARLQVVSFHFLNPCPLNSHCFVLFFSCERASVAGGAEAARGAKRLVLS